MAKQEVTGAGWAMDLRMNGTWEVVAMGGSSRSVSIPEITSWTREGLEGQVGSAAVVGPLGTLG